MAHAILPLTIENRIKSLNFKLNMVGREKAEDTESGEETEWASYFDEKYLDPTCKRFQMGWQVGVGFQYKPIMLSVSYGTDFIPFWKYQKAKINSGNLAVTVGYCF